VATREAPVSRTHQQLRDEIALREASLADAERELGAGELSVAQARAIETRERAALAAARAELAQLRDDAPARTKRRRRRWLLVSGLACFLAAAVIVLFASLSPRQAGTSITGSVQLGHAQQITQLLTEAQADVANGNEVAALSAYQQILKLDPTNAAALSETGWLEFSAGSSRHDVTLVDLGIKDLTTAIADAPRNAAARLYYAIVAYKTPGNRALAKDQFAVFLRLHPSIAQVAIAEPYLRALGLLKGAQ